MNIIDVNGLNFSGKSALVDLLREYECIEAPHYAEEFDLIRMPGGLGSLYDAFVAGEEIRIDSAIRRFKQTVKYLARNPKGFSRFFRSGLNYGQRYPSFETTLKKFIDQIIIDKWYKKSPYETPEVPKSQIFFDKLKGRLSGRLNWPYIDFHLGDRDAFFKLVERIVPAILESAKSSSQKTKIVIQNASGVVNPKHNISIIPKAKWITVLRDPRDMYINSNVKTKMNEAKIFLVVGILNFLNIF